MAYEPVHQSDIENQGFISEDPAPSRKQKETLDIDDGETAEVHVVKWENFRLPIPLDHAVFMRKVFLTLVLQLIVTAGTVLHPLHCTALCCAVSILSDAVHLSSLSAVHCTVDIEIEPFL